MIRILIRVFIIYIFFSSTVYSNETSALNHKEIETSIQNNLRYESDSINRYIIYRGFVVQYNHEKRSPNYTIHRLSVNQISPKFGSKAKRRSNFFVDDYNLGQRSALNRDYYKSGWDKGHMVPSGDFYWNQLLKNETFVLTNISPQNPSLNRGKWANLENATRNIIINLNNEAYIITGACYSDENGITTGPNKVEIPLYLYKLIYIPEASIMYAFLFNNQIGEYKSNLNEYQIRVDDIEKITNEDFFDRLPDELENVLESTIKPFN